MIRLTLIPPAEDPLAALAARLPGLLRESLEQALEYGLAASRSAMGRSGPQIRSGRLAASLAARIEGAGDSLVGGLLADTPYAAAQEYGATIQAKKSNYLKFQVEGRWVQKRSVTLPARPYLRPGLDEAARRLPEILARRLREEFS